jgi:hypothetical protein
VSFRKLVNEEAQAHWGLSHQKQTKIITKNGEKIGI